MNSKFFFTMALVLGLISLYCPSLNKGAESASAGCKSQVQEKIQPKETKDTSRIKRIPFFPYALHKMKYLCETLYDTFFPPSHPRGFDIPVVVNGAVKWHIHSFTGPKRDTFAQWLFRAKRHEPTIRTILKRNGLPEDLAYVAMIESGLYMRACSRSRAMGPWQFMSETGREYGLRTDYWVDERYDLDKSTQAAARYLKKLHRQFGCWYLVAASYNAGGNRVRKAMDTSGTKDFWVLRKHDLLPEETQEYVPQLMAAATIAKDPEKFGFKGIPLTFSKELTVDVPGGVPLDDIARIFSVDVAEIKTLNPELLRHITPPNRVNYRLKLPDTRKTELVARNARGLKWERRVVAVTEHRMITNETPAVIERRYNVSGSDLALVNDGRPDTGQVLYIPHFAAPKRLAKMVGSNRRSESEKGYKRGEQQK